MNGRKCAICGKPGGTPVSLSLKWLGLKGNYAHIHCIQIAKRLAARMPT